MSIKLGRMFWFSPNPLDQPCFPHRGSDGFGRIARTNATFCGANGVRTLMLWRLLGQNFCFTNLQMIESYSSFYEVELENDPFLKGNCTVLVLKIYSLFSRPCLLGKDLTSMGMERGFVHGKLDVGSGDCRIVLPQLPNLNAQSPNKTFGCHSCQQKGSVISTYRLQPSLSFSNSPAKIPEHLPNIKTYIYVLFPFFH